MVWLLYKSSGGGGGGGSKGLEGEPGNEVGGVGGGAWKQSWKEVVSFPDPQAKKRERVWEIALLVCIALAAEFMECNYYFCIDCAE